MNCPIYVVDEVSRAVCSVENVREAQKLYRYDPTNFVPGVELLYSLSLPLPLVNKIINFVGIWTRRAEELTHSINGRADLDTEILHLVVPFDAAIDGVVQVRPPVELVFDCVSHDQGWATENPELNHTYQGCHSWIEFEIQDAHGVTIVPRRDVCRNFRASSSSRHHMLIVRDRDVLENVLPGHSIVVHMRAQYGGWANHVDFCRVALHHVAHVRDEVDQFELRKWAKTALLHADPGQHVMQRQLVPLNLDSMMALVVQLLRSYCTVS
ncbi:hypothetical protein DYB25_010187 [Aphanomyces astaci]|uniref:Uncharacterized protein n=1 Tax=Aphanomyces astaci TaxID=112090 RepID=A0A397BE55_APHAT|nr:hypothetical protein DYB25_010187 [Aphanomyces astaci]